MPQEQEIPAPVTTTIFFPFATEREISARARLTCESVAAASRSRVTVMMRAVVRQSPNSTKISSGSFCYLVFVLDRDASITWGAFRLITLTRI